MLGLCAAAVFAVVAALLLRVMPRPLRPTDAMVVGALATLAAMVVLFAGYMLITGQRNVFFRTRRK
jgi:uncharacterized membrane protein YozB (DUF420 family)